MRAALERFLAKSPDENGHGKRTTYSALHCRCDACRAANSRYVTDLRARLRAQPVPTEAHGRATGYQDRGCRCDLCKAWRSETQRRQNAKRAGRRGTFLDSLTVDTLRPGR